MKTIFNTILDDWKRVKNHCRTTDNKDFTENNVNDEFKKKLLISEHSPIRLLEFDWSWKGIKYWVSTEWSRHRFEKFISSQRDDRLKDGTSRDKKTQDALVNFDGYANMQNLIDTWRKRLCFQATREARELAEDFKCELQKTHPLEANVLVPNCIYRLVLQRTLIALFKYPPVFDIIKGGGYYDDKYSIRPTAIRTVGS